MMSTKSCLWLDTNKIVSFSVHLSIIHPQGVIKDDTCLWTGESNTYYLGYTAGYDCEWWALTQATPTYLGVILYGLWLALFFGPLVWAELATHRLRQSARKDRRVMILEIRR